MANSEVKTNKVTSTEGTVQISPEAGSTLVMNVDGDMQCAHITTPDNPPSGYTALYFKNDDVLYKKTSAGVESAVGGTTSLTASRAVVSDGSGNLTVVTTTATEIGYVNGVTSAIQTQLNAKAPTASPTFTGTVTAANLTASGTVTASALTAESIPYLNTSKQLTSSEYVRNDLGGGYVGFLRHDSTFGSFGSAFSLDPIFWVSKHIFPYDANGIVGANNTAGGADRARPFKGGALNRLWMGYTVLDSLDSVSAGTIKVKTGTNLTLDADTVVISKQIKYGVYSNGNSGTTKTVDWNNGMVQSVTMTGNCTFTLSNPQTGTTYVLKLVQDATGSRTYTWPATVIWPGGSAPTGSGASKADIVTLFWDGTNYFGSYNLNYTP